MSILTVMTTCWGSSSKAIFEYCRELISPSKFSPLLIFIIWEPLVMMMKQASEIFFTISDDFPALFWEIVSCH